MALTQGSQVESVFQAQCDVPADGFVHPDTVRTRWTSRAATHATLTVKVGPVAALCMQSGQRRDPDRRIGSLQTIRSPEAATDVTLTFKVGSVAASGGWGGQGRDPDQGSRALRAIRRSRAARDATLKFRVGCVAASAAPPLVVLVRNRMLARVARE